jgi:hypothetical protein
MSRSEPGTPTMADLIVLYWHDIPAQVIAKAGRRTAKRALSLRFTEAIDMAAMRSGAHGTDDYLAAWRRADPVPCGDDLDAEAQAAAIRIEADYDADRLERLVQSHGRAEG